MTRKTRFVGMLIILCFNIFALGDLTTDGLVLELDAGNPGQALFTIESRF